MKKSIGLLMVSCLFTSLALTGCKSPNEKIEDAKEDVIDAKEKELDAEKQVNEAKNNEASDYTMLKVKTKALIAENERRIAEFKVKLKTESAGKQQQFQEQIDKLEEKNNKLKDDLDNFTEEGAEKWDAFRTRVQKSVDDIKKDIDDYKKEHNYD